MSSVGVGTSTFAGITMLYNSPAGKTYYNVTAGEADCTPDNGPNAKEWAPGDKADWGTSDMEVLIQGTKISEIDDLISARTVATLTHNLALEVAGNTASTLIGQAFISTHSLVASENGALTGPISFRWTTKPEFTDEA